MAACINWCIFGPSQAGALLRAFFGFSTLRGGVLLGGPTGGGSWGPAGVLLGSTGVLLRSYWGPRAVLLGSYFGLTGVLLWSYCGGGLLGSPVGVLLGSYWGPSGVQLGSYWGLPASLGQVCELG